MAMRRSVLVIVAVVLVFFFAIPYLPPSLLGLNTCPTYSVNSLTPLKDDRVDRTQEDNENGNETSFARIGKITMLYGDPNPVYERALDSHRRHADVHGYEFFVLRQKMLGRLWTKPAYVLSVVLAEMAKPPAERLEWLFWFDADTFLLNPQIPLEVFLPPENLQHIYFLCANDHNGLNDGAFLLRVNDFAVHMLSASLSVETYRPEVNLKYSEQSAIEHVVNSNDIYRTWDGTTYYDGFANIPQRWMNAYMGSRNEQGVPVPRKKKLPSDVKEGDLLVHFVGSGDTKRRRMVTFMDSWDLHRDTWEKPVEETGLEEELAEFWKTFAQGDEQRRASHKKLINNDKANKS